MRTLPALLLLATLTACHGLGTISTPDAEAAPLPATPPMTAPAAARPLRADPGQVGDGTPLTPQPGNALAAFAAGCFWGIEDTFRHVPGVVATAVGYTGGHTAAPSYEAVCTHTTGHAETVLVEFDPKAVSYETLLNVFFKNHNPTTKNRQGPDVGDQYRSAVFTFSPEQAAAAAEARTRESAALGKAVVTEIGPLGRFWKAEDYHQQYDERTGTHSCPLPRGLPPQPTKS